MIFQERSSSEQGLFLFFLRIFSRLFYGNLYIFKGEEIMCKRIRKYIRKLIRSNRKTFKNKLCAIALLSLWMFAAIISNDWTFFVFTSFLAIPLLVAKENYIYGWAGRIETKYKVSFLFFFASRNLQIVLWRNG